MDESIWFKDFTDLDLEDIAQMKLCIQQGKLPDSDWHQKPSAENPDGITMDEWMETVQNECKRLGI